MTGRFAACLVVGVACLSLTAQEPLKKEEIKKQAQGLGDATIKGDYAKVIDATHDGIVKLMGGRDKAIKAIETGMKGVADKGFTITKFTVGDAGESFTEGANTFVILPTAMEMKTPGGKIASKSYLLGISPDGGKTWKFADGAGLGNKDLRDRALPKLPEKLKLPDPQPPEAVKE